MTLNEKSLNYKVVDFVETHKFRMKFIFIRVHTKKLRFFENRLTLTTIGHDSFYAIVPNRRGARRQVTVASAIAVAHGGLPLPLWATTVVG
jgi:uncharacterized protein YfdQ (DUF2303 family)